jgi:hypothetical protein
MSRRHLRRKTKAQRHAKAPDPSAVRPDPFGLTPESFYSSAPVSVKPARVAVREACDVERLAYTRSQAAEALGIGRSTFTQRVLPYLETIETPWGTTLIPADELQRVVLEWRRPGRPRGGALPQRTGRPRTIAPDIVQRIRDASKAGLSLRQIADSLNADGTPTAHGGARWWASTVRSVLST